MGRNPKDSTNVLVRLRKALAKFPGSGGTFTRKKLADRAGISASTIREIETGGFALTEEMAIKIAHATQVSPRSLLLGEDPLRDWHGHEFSKESKRLPEDPWWWREDQEAREQVFAAALATAREKKAVPLFYFMFDRSMAATIKALRADTVFEEKLTDRLPEFDLYRLIEFRPKNKRLAERWDEFEYQLMKEFSRRLEQDEIDNPGYWQNVDTASVDHQHRLLEIQRQAREEVSRRWREETAKAEIIKPLSGKRPRSPGRLGD